MNITDKISLKEIVKWRRYLHQNPELSFHEFNTAKYIYDLLSSFPNLILETPTQNSVIATLKGDNYGKVIALRADIDALAIDEESDVTFPSKNSGIMHACGHDAHTAMLLEAIKVLSYIPNKLYGTIKFIFQPAEEMPPGGAREIVDAGVLDNVDFIFGLHIFPTIPTGIIEIRKGAMTAAADNFDLYIHGKGAHGSMPDISIDPILIGVEIINNINNIISRNISPFENAVVSIGEFSSGHTANVIPDSARIQGTVRTTNSTTRLFIKSQIEKIINNIANIYGATYDLNYILGYSPIINDAIATEIVKNAALKVVKESDILETQRLMIGEDFSAYTNVTKGAFFFLGGGSSEDGYKYINHHPKFKIDENALLIGTKMHIQIILDTLESI